MESGVKKEQSKLCICGPVLVNLNESALEMQIEGVPEHLRLSGRPHVQIG